jgi:4'-phosphopantetheinyl transferase
VDRAPDRVVHAWVVPAGHRQRADAQRLLAEAGGQLLGTDPAQVEVVRDATGQPAVRTAAGGRAWVSLSYAPGLLAVAASLAGPVGVDVEGSSRGDAVQPEVARLAERWFDPDEAAWLRDRPAAERSRDFLLLWTAKEALGKALGLGLRGSGLRRRVPLPPVTDGSFSPVAPGLWLAYPVLRSPNVVAVASGVPVSALVLRNASDHVVPAPSTARSRTSLPVVVRGN